MKTCYQILVVLIIICVSAFSGYTLRGVNDSKPILQEASIVHDSFRVVVPVPNVFFYPVPMDIDTAQIIQDYFAARVYTDTIVKTNTLTVVVHDTITHNAIDARDVEYIEEPIIRHIPPKYSLSGSVLVGKYSTPVMLSLRRKNVGYMAGYDLKNCSPMLGISYTFKSWK